MQINWHKNPLMTTVSLTETEKEIFRLKVAFADYEEAVHSALFYLDEKESKGKYFSVEKARQSLERLVKDDDNDSSGTDEEFKYLLQQLESGIHCGDCTCVACSCSKCRAESILGIDTTKGLEKHAAYKIDGAFGKDGTRTIEEAIQTLADYNPVRSGGWEKMAPEAFEIHVPRWKLEAKKAHEWLVSYRDEHFADGSDGTAASA